ncbi:MAG TPA: LuxR C-terminal-related transcriptional regulator, partial [Candidatus Binatia bacterium]|nr:LuxR C-terminal-related transcriptional regulator [Candidatus Binatia bacterium]
MTDRAGVARRLLVGRAGEAAAVVGLIQGAVRGEAGALLVSGEAGVGKTVLVREACARGGDAADVVWGSCLPLTSLAVPFMPLASALRAWAADRNMPVPVLAGLAGDAPAGFDAWLEERCREHPVALVVDDLQWADQSTLDVLMYVLAGLAGRRLAMLATVRTGEEAHPLRRWLADVRRFPGVGELHLDRLDRVATAEQLAALLGRPPHQSLVDAVYGRTQGNAYLTALLVRGLSPDARSLPSGLPTDLREAASRAWFGLSASAQELSALVAVAGRPQQADHLGKMAAATGLDGDVVPLLREAVDAAVLDVDSDDAYWFVHPLLAEVLEAGLLPEERRTLHTAFAAALELAGVADEMGVEAAVELADHHHRAGHQKEAYRWALLGADAAGRVGGAAEMLRLLRRALDLWPQVPDPGVSRQDLLQRIRDAADQAGEQEEELAAVDDLLALIDREAQPLLAAELLVRRMCLRLTTGLEFAGLDDVREAVRLSASHPESAEHALAVAELAHAELWHAEPSGPARAEEALRLARACGSPRALSYALTANVMRRLLADETGGLAQAEEAQEAAAQARDFFAFCHAALWAGNCVDSAASRPVIERWRRSREELTALGAPHTYIARLSESEAMGLLLLGDWQACEERLRVALGTSPGPMSDIGARLTAALLSCWQGRRVDADAHLSRAEELSAAPSEFLAFEFDAVRAELAVAVGDTERAITAALTGLDGEGAAPTLCERLVPLAARASADHVQTVRDRGEDPMTATMRLDDLQRRYPKVVAEPGPGPMYEAQVRAMQVWYEAEVQRGQEDPAAAATWLCAAQACADAELAWDEAYTSWRAAEALLPDRSRRDQAMTALRRAHDLAVDLRAAPLLAEVEALARSARVPLAAPEAAPAETAAAMPGLTPREREILAHVVAGRTYGEIARELVISEKTVSVHISNLLHKTGTKSRVELAQLARR